MISNRIIDALMAELATGNIVAEFSFDGARISQLAITN